jgi:parvulin-like peptidyl-prolyl isomerase
MSKLMKLVFGGLVGVVLAYGVASAEVVDKVIVVVNNEVVSQKEFDRAFIPLKKSYETNFQGEELAKRLEDAKKALLEQIINTKLAISLAKAAKVEVKEADLQKRIDTIKGYYGSEDEFNKELAARGTAYPEFVKEVKEQMMAQDIVDKEVASKIVIAPADINKLYETNKEKLIAPDRVKLKGILVKRGEGVDDAAAKKKIDEALAKIKAGEDFGKVAAQYTEGPYVDNGGDMGFVMKGQLLPEIDAVVFAAAKGTVTAVVETKLGYHIFKIEDVEKTRQLSLDEVADFLRGQIFRKKFEEELTKWLEEKRKNAYIAYK